MSDRSNGSSARRTPASTVDIAAAPPRKGREKDDRHSNGGRNVGDVIGRFRWRSLPQRRHVERDDGDPSSTGIVDPRRLLRRRTLWRPRRALRRATSTTINVVS